MNKAEFINGFSGKSSKEKARIVSSHVSDPEAFLTEIRKFDHPEAEMQEKLQSFSENTIANYSLPFGVAPNFRINGKNFIIPMVIEESSVVAAASSAAKFWFEKGGFEAKVSGMTKTGHIYFFWRENPSKLKQNIPYLKAFILNRTDRLTSAMQARGGGITDIELVDLSARMPKMYQIKFSFITADAMGANFINSVLEEASLLMKEYFKAERKGALPTLDILMAILSNYTPDCRVKVQTTACISLLDSIHPLYTGMEFAERFVSALNVANCDISRAVTNNKGIYNGMDAVLLATGNDYRAAEAAGHAYASRDGVYRPLSFAEVKEGRFIHGLEVPLSIGTVGGLTGSHPLARWALDLLGKPTAEELMMIIASAGLANNFSATMSILTDGIQKGHMKLHLDNILNSLDANVSEKELVKIAFRNKQISYRNVEEYLNKIRSG